MRNTKKSPSRPIRVSATNAIRQLREDLDRLGVWARKADVIFSSIGVVLQENTKWKTQAKAAHDALEKRASLLEAREQEKRAIASNELTLAKIRERASQVFGREFSVLHKDVIERNALDFAIWFMESSHYATTPNPNPMEYLSADWIDRESPHGWALHALKMARDLDRVNANVR